MKTEVLALEVGTSNTVALPVQVGMEARVVGVFALVSALADGEGVALDMTRSGQTLLSVGTGGCPASTGAVQFGIGLPPLQTMLTNIDPVTGDVAFHQDLVLAQGSVVDVWWQQPVTVQMTSAGTITGMIVLYERRSL